MAAFQPLGAIGGCDHREVSQLFKRIGEKFDQLTVVIHDEDRSLRFLRSKIVINLHCEPFVAACGRSQTDNVKRKAARAGAKQVASRSLDLSGLSGKSSPLDRSSAV